MLKNDNLNTAIVCGLLALAPAAQANNFTITTIDCPSGLYTQPVAINAGGEVTGQCDDNIGWHAFVKSGAAITTFDGGVPNMSTGATSINAGGTVTGTYLDGVGPSKGFVNSNGVTSLFTILDATNAPSTLVNPRSINVGGKIVGEYLDVILPSSGIYRGFIYDSTTNTYAIIDGMPLAPGNGTIPVSINDSDQVAGSAANHGFVYSAGAVTLFDAPNAVQTVPRSINNSGQVAGMYYDANYVSHGFLYSGGVATTVDIPGAAATDIWGVNDSGQLAGYYTDAAGVSHGFVQTGATVTTIDVAGATGIGTVPWGINAGGQVVGWYTDAAGATHGFVTSAITGAPTVPLAVATSLPAATVGVAYKGTVTASKGTAPYTISVSGLPAGLINTNGLISGTPTTAGTYALIINAGDSVGDVGSATAALTVAAAPASTAVANAGKSTITAVNGTSFTIATGGVITTNAATKIEWNRKNHVYLVGDRVEWEGKTVNGVFVASIVTLN